MLEHVIVRQPLSEVKQLSMKELMQFRDSVRIHVFLNRVVSTLISVATNSTITT